MSPSDHRGRPHVRHLLMASAAVVGLAVNAAACSSGTSGTAAQNTTPKTSVAVPGTATALLTETAHAVAAAGSMHFVQVTTSGRSTVTVRGALSKLTAQETLTQSGSRLVVELIDGTLYVNGPSAVLQSALSLPSSVADAHAGKWISLTPYDAPFKDVQQTLTVSSEVLPFVPIEPGLRRLAEATLHGSPVVPVIGAPATATAGSSGTSTMFVDARHSHLPVGASVLLHQGTQKENQLVIYTRWGQPVQLTPPSGPVAYSAIKGG